MDGLHLTKPWILLIYFAVAAIMTAARSTANASPSFTTGNKTIHAHVGDTAVLPCSVKNLGTKEVIWKNEKEKHVLTIGMFVFIADDSYSVQHKDNRNNWNLVIKNVQKEHNGKYECQISTKEDKKVVITLKVSDPPPPVPTTSTVHISGKNFVEKGAAIVLSCNATGSSITPDDIDWFKDGIKLKSSASDDIYITKYRKADTKTLYSKLEIKHSKMSDKAAYICRSTDLAIAHHDIIVLNAESTQQKRHNGGTKINESKPQVRKESYTNGNSYVKSSSLFIFLMFLQVLLHCNIHIPR